MVKPEINKPQKKIATRIRDYSLFGLAFILVVILHSNRKENKEVFVTAGKFLSALSRYQQ